MMSLVAAKAGANRLQLGFDIHGPDQQNHMHMHAISCAERAKLKVAH